MTIPGASCPISVEPGARAPHAEPSLAEAGLPHLRILEGGVLAWQATNAPINRSRARRDLERQVRLAGTMPHNRGATCDRDTIVGQLRDTASTGSRP